MKSPRPVEESAAKLRGFFATRFNEYALLHQHIDMDKLLYRYPRIQYKILDGVPLVLGIEEGAEVLKFITPWIALSQTNHQRYLESKREQRR